MMYAFLFSKAANLLISALCLCSSVICILVFSLGILFEGSHIGEREGDDQRFEIGVERNQRRES